MFFPLEKPSTVTQTLFTIPFVGFCPWNILPVAKQPNIGNSWASSALHYHELMCPTERGREFISSNVQCNIKVESSFCPILNHTETQARDTVPGWVVCFAICFCPFPGHGFCLSYLQPMEAWLYVSHLYLSCSCYATQLYSSCVNDKQERVSQNNEFDLMSGG